MQVDRSRVVRHGPVVKTCARAVGLNRPPEGQTAFTVDERHSAIAVLVVGVRRSELARGRSDLSNPQLSTRVVHRPVSYTHSDAADEEDSVALGGRRIIKQQKTKKSVKILLKKRLCDKMEYGR